VPANNPGTSMDAADSNSIDLEDEDAEDDFKITQAELTDTRAACPQDAYLMTDVVEPKSGFIKKWRGHTGVSILPGEEKKFCLLLNSDHDFMMVKSFVKDSLRRDFEYQMLSPDSATPVSVAVKVLGDENKRVSAGVYVFTIRMSIPSWVDLKLRPEYATTSATVGMGFRRVNKNPDVLMKCPSGTIETTKSWTEDVYVLKYGVSPGAVARVCVLLKKPRESLYMGVGSYNNGSCGPMNLTGKSLSYPKIPEVSDYNLGGQPNVSWNKLIRPGVYLFEGTWPDAAGRGSCSDWERVGFSWQ